MDNSLYVGLSKQMVLQQQMDIIANNIANVDTSGFKVESLMTAQDPLAPAKTLGVQNPVDFVVSNGVVRDFSEGPLRQTGAPLDVAIDGNGFFSVQTPTGPRYTRDGRFKTDDTGQLVNQSGLPVLDDGGSPIVIDAQKGPVAVSADGVITQNGERTGKIGVVTFDSLTGLSKTGDNLYQNTSNLQSKPATDIKLRQGMLEGSNVQPILEISRMIEVSRAYDQMAQLMTSQADLSTQAIQTLGKSQ
jgi:flagellar basal-body rod protein FlgF